MTPDSDTGWVEIPAMLRRFDPLPLPWEDIFGPLRGNPDGQPIIVAQFGQSIDARIATVTGHSHYINGAAGLAHLHRLRALVDAVVVGVGTAIADNPLLTVRRVAGPNPARIVIDPHGRLPPTARLLADDGARRLVLTGDQTRAAHPGGTEIISLPWTAGQLAPATILSALAEQGFRRILIEGGANTVSRFLAAGCLDRLHVVIAPMIIGSGASSVTLPPIAHLDQALRCPMRAHILQDEVLLDCDLSGHRAVAGMANTSV